MAPADASAFLPRRVRGCTRPHGVREHGAALVESAAHTRAMRRCGLLNDLVGLMEHVRNNRQPEGCRRLQINRELDLGVDLHGNL